MNLRALVFLLFVLFSKAEGVESDSIVCLDWDDRSIENVELVVTGPICSVDARPKRLKQIMERIMIQNIERCVNNLNTRYNSLDISIGVWTAMINRNCCPIPVNPCPCDVSDLRFGHVDLYDCLYN